ncbi:hypothetical protein D3C87_1162220 [compost metagenome]
MANLSGGLIAVEDGQSAVHQDRFENQALGTAHRLHAIGGDADCKAETAQHGFDDRLVDRIVLDQQHIAPLTVAFARRRTRRQYRQRLLIQRQRDFQGEHRAATFFALGAQGAAHAFGERARNRQAQAGAAVTS